VGSKKIGLEISSNKTKYMVVSRNRNVEEIHSMKIGNNSFEWVEPLKYLGRNLADQNSFGEQIKSILNSGDAW